MNIRTLTDKARSLYNGPPPTVLKADEATGEFPFEFLMTDEHTEHYPSLKSSDEERLGIMTGVIFLVFTVAPLLLALARIIRGDWSDSLPLILVATTVSPLSFLWESRQPLPLPIILNRRTREVYFDHNGKLFHTPWDEIQAIAYEFKIVSPHGVSLNNAALEILIHRLGDPENALMLRLGLPMGKNLSMQKGFWEYLRAYMDKGPWLDESGNHCESDTFIKEQLKSRIRLSQLLAHDYKSLWEENAAAGGTGPLNYLAGIILLTPSILHHPSNLIQDLVYDTAKRRARNRWPEIVLERLRPDGPTTRLIDLERERGIDV